MRYNFLSKLFYQLVFTLFILAQSLQKQDILLTPYFSYNVANHRQVFLFFFIWKSWNFHSLCSEPIKIYRDGKQGVFEIS